jgi:hypothetical protein
VDTDRLNPPRKADVEVWMLDFASSRWLDLVHTSAGWTGPISIVVPPRVMRRGTPLCRDGGISRTCGVRPLRFMRRHWITFDHFGSGISRDQTCSWGTKPHRWETEESWSGHGDWDPRYEGGVENAPSFESPRYRSLPPDLRFVDFRAELAHDRNQCFQGQRRLGDRQPLAHRNRNSGQRCRKGPGPVLHHRNRSRGNDTPQDEAEQAMKRAIERR